MIKQAIILSAAFGAAFIFARASGENGAAPAHDPMEQARALMAQLQANDWDTSRIDRLLLRLPDQQFAESKSERGPQFTSFAVTAKGPRGDELGFYSSLYVRMNPTYVGGDSWEVDPSGHFLVGYKDGRVARVPVVEARMQLRDDIMPGETVAVPVFPGMRGYDTSVPFRDFSRDPFRYQRP